jgi:glucose/arabinose dehydrogenase
MGLVGLGIVVPPFFPETAWAQAFTGAPTPQAPGLTLAVDRGALAAPYATPSAGNFAQSISFPSAPTLAVPPGFSVTVFARTGLASARNLIVAPNGDVLVAEQSAGRVTLLRDSDGDGRAELTTTFAANFSQPYGLAMTATDLYVADVTAIWRLPYSAGATAATARTQLTPYGALGDAQGHSTRNLALSPSGDRLYVAIGSRGNIGEEASPRATIQEFRLDGGGQRTFASGLRNPVGLAFEPGSGALYSVVNERDGMGDELVPDYMARVVDGGFYGWPYSYFGANVQPNFAPAQTANGQARIASARVPEVGFRSHSAPLGMAFATGTPLPAEYQNGAFVALHGSWNAAVPRGYMVVFVPTTGGVPNGDHRIFASGFWTQGTARAQVIGRPAAVAMAKDGAVLIADDVSNTVWRVAYTAGSATLIGVLPAASVIGQSFIRLHNADTVAGSVQLVIRTAADGRLAASWTSPSIAPQASRQFAWSTIEAAAVPPLTGSNAAGYAIEARPSFNGSLQHVVWSPSSGALANLTRCDIGPTGDLKTLINVHATRLSTYPSTVRVYNAGTTAASAAVAIHDAATGARLATWTTPSLEAGAMLEAPVAALEAAATPPLTAPPDHLVLVLDGSYPGVLQHLVRGPSGTLTDITDRCNITR